MKNNFFQLISKWNPDPGHDHDSKKKKKKIWKKIAEQN